MTYLRKSAERWICCCSVARRFTRHASVQNPNSTVCTSATPQISQLTQYVVRGGGCKAGVDCMLDHDTSMQPGITFLLLAAVCALLAGVSEPALTDGEATEPSDSFSLVIHSTCNKHSEIAFQLEAPWSAPEHGSPRTNTDASASKTLHANCVKPRQQPTEPFQGTRTSTPPTTLSSTPTMIAHKEKSWLGKDKNTDATLTSWSRVRHSGFRRPLRVSSAVEAPEFRHRWASPRPCLLPSALCPATSHK